jgi:hypothetical protein
MASDVSPKPSREIPKANRADRLRSRDLRENAGRAFTLALIRCSARVKKFPGAFITCRRPGFTCSRPFSDLFNVAASRSAQMTTIVTITRRFGGSQVSQYGRRCGNARDQFVARIDSSALAAGCCSLHQRVRRKQASAFAQTPLRCGGGIARIGARTEGRKCPCPRHVNCASVPSCGRSASIPVPGAIPARFRMRTSTSRTTSASRRRWNAAASTPSSSPITWPCSTCRWRR